MEEQQHGLHTPVIGQGDLAAADGGQGEPGRLIANPQPGGWRWLTTGQRQRNHWEQDTQTHTTS